MRLLRNTTWRLLGRRLTAAVTLLAYVATMCGVPLPALATQHSDQAFPCRGLLCGCMTAEQCNSCGCFTPAELASSANSHNVPPSKVEKPVPDEKPPEKTSAPSCCCGKGEQPKEGCPHCASKTPMRSCCGPVKAEKSSPPTAPKKKAASCEQPKPGGSCCQTHPGLPPEGDKDGVRWGIVGAWRCQGLTLHWVSSGVVAASIPVVWAPMLTPAGWLTSTATFAVHIPFIPPDPPPRS
jgi:hypothetical protein